MPEPIVYHWNTSHRECTEGEMLLGNIREGDNWFTNLSLSSKRLGVTSYFDDGTVIKGYRPIIVNREEYDTYRKNLKG